MRVARSLCGGLLAVAIDFSAGGKGSDSLDDCIEAVLKTPGYAAAHWGLSSSTPRPARRSTSGTPTRCSARPR